MPTFIDRHDMKGLSKDKVEKLINSPTDKHKVTNMEILYNEKENKMLCILEGPNKEAIKKHHHELGFICEFIMEVTEIKKESSLRTERLGAMGELSARVAHDLRNPLGVIKNAVELTEMTLKDTTDEKMKKRITVIKNAAEKMSRQINDVLDFVRTRPPQLQNNSISAILNSALKNMKTENIKITKPDNDVTIQCDSKQLEVAFGNLITNSIQAIEDKGEIKIRVIENDNEVKIEVEDSGPGIPEDDIQRIFDPLFTTKSSGTGLGLVSSKNIVEQHGGTISVKNNPTIFEIKLPKK